MKIITVEEHFTTPEAAKIIADYKATLPNQDKIKADDAAMTAGMVAAAPNVEEMIDVDQLRIDYMDKNHIDMQVVSAAGITPQLLPDNLSIDACRDLNDALAKHIANHPDRFVGFATLPANNPAAAATELNRAVTELGLKGALFSGTINGEF
ncbi:amidohydrolase family protein [Lentilactobacillus kosonis]|uniref:2-amino-3-carboxymuconate-6-semialdehyde decarboxylase n=1 Tax=Lentilactobacillus kosonis TaxID=2810561 RepID=A0A401FNZ1_9LACO|nr:amidohydrolase family protein [Lentilactobacillus kosonis]GAY73988.1 2-amino-3-carboxymuconate-6-semialdehyde decarboxylase [Lentilactobacillus kosonis]